MGQYLNCHLQTLHSSWNNLAIETFHPHNIIPFVMRVIFTIIVLIIIIIICIVCNPSMKKKFQDWKNDNNTQNEPDIYSSMELDTIPPPIPRKNTISQFINKSLESLHLKQSLNQEPNARISRVHLPPSELNNEYIIFPTPAQQHARRKSLGHQSSSNFEKPVQEKRKSVNFDNRQQTSL